MKITLFYILLLLSSLLYAQEKRNYTASSNDDLKITVNGELDESAWENANWESNFIQHEPVQGAAPYKQTEFAVLYDANNLYVAIRSFDNPDSISMRMSRRDDIEGDLVGVFFDSYFDKRTSFGFILSAAGVRSDIINSNDGENEDDTWDPIWWAKTTKTKQGWNAEIRIPLTQLRFEENNEQLWGFQVLRYVFRKEELSAWQAMDRERSGFASQFGTLNGITNIKPQKVLNVTPYVVASSEKYEADADNPFKSTGRSNDINAGLDAKIGLTNYLTLDLTVNPDFGQVEADPSEVNLTTNESFFEEKRPFFIEGRNILSYGLSAGDGDLASNNLFYSRRIGRPPHHYPDTETGEYADVPDYTNIIAAAKITGKTKNGWSIGLLESITAEENAEIKSIQDERSQTVEPLTNYFVGRVQKDFNKGNTNIGAIVTGVNRNIKDEHLEYLHDNAYSGGIDFMHQWNEKKWIVSLGTYFSRVEGTEEALLRTQTAYSRTFQRPDADYVSVDSSLTSLSGNGGKFSIGKVSGKLKFGAMFNWKSPGLEINDIGFSPEVDEMLQILWSGYRWYEPFSIFRNASINLNQWSAYDFGGNLNVMGGNINGHAQFKNYWRTFGMFNKNGEILSNSVLRGGPSLKLPGQKRFYMGVFTNSQKKFTFGVDGGVSWSNEPGFAGRKSIEFGVTYRPFQAMQIEIEPEYSLTENTLQYVSQDDYQDGKQYTMGQIHRTTLNMSIRINYSITPDLTIQYWGQPFIATGEYSDFKYITDSKAENVYDRYELYSDEQISYNELTENYLIDFDKDGTVDYSFGKPDFNFQEFLSNLVLRWEYRPGSTFYLVWSQNRVALANKGRFDLDENISSLFDEKANDIFLLKFSYRFGR